MAPPLYPALCARLKPLETPECHIDVSWLDDAAIWELNRDHRNKNKPTDVLSFPLFEGEVFLLGEEPLELGDLVISVETAHRQAGELRHSLERETAFLAIHGTLHLLGYDHVTDSQRRKMFGWQDKVFAGLETQGGL